MVQLFIPMVLVLWVAWVVPRSRRRTRRFKLSARVR
jgi:flagellar biogenesis protein FliO